jgi:hypothetical protein
LKSFEYSQWAEHDREETESREAVQHRTCQNVSPFRVLIRTYHGSDSALRRANSRRHRAREQFVALNPSNAQVWTRSSSLKGHNSWNGCRWIPWSRSHADDQRQKASRHSALAIACREVETRILHLEIGGRVRRRRDTFGRNSASCPLVFPGGGVGDRRNTFAVRK